MPRATQKHPAFTDGPMPVHAPLVRWALSVTSPLQLEISPAEDPRGQGERVLAVNPESRALLVGLARAAAPGADSVVTAFEPLCLAIRLSPQRARFWLKALAAAGLIRVDGLQRGHEGMVAVRFLGVTDG